MAKTQKAQKQNRVQTGSLGAMIKRDYQLYLMLLPVVIYYIIFMYKPMYGLQIAFKDYSLFKGILDSPWCGWKHFINFFNGPFFARTLKNTLWLSILGLIVNMPAQIILALLFNELRQGVFKSTIQTISYLPHFISTVVIAGIVTNFLAPSNGIINIIIEKLGGEKIYFLVKPQYFRAIFTLMNVWAGTGFGTIVYMAALSGIDSCLYEASIIDGAGKLSQIIHVTLPGILPTIITMLIMNVGSLLNVSYEAIILLYQPATYETSDVISTYVYRSGLVEGHYDFATAVGFFNSFVALLLTTVANIISRKTAEISLW